MCLHVDLAVDRCDDRAITVDDEGDPAVGRANPPLDAEAGPDDAVRIGQKGEPEFVQLVELLLLIDLISADPRYPGAEPIELGFQVPEVATFPGSTAGHGLRVEVQDQEATLQQLIQRDGPAELVGRSEALDYVSLLHAADGSGPGPGLSCLHYAKRSAMPASALMSICPCFRDCSTRKQTASVQGTERWLSTVIGKAVGSKTVPKRIEISLPDYQVTCSAVFHEDLAPRTCAAIWDVLPHRGTARHSFDTGREIWTGLEPMEEIKEVKENLVIYPQPGDCLYSYFPPAWEGGSRGRRHYVYDFAIWYGPDSAIHTSHGFHPMNQFATIVEGLDEFAAAASRLIAEGESDIVITRQDH